jgi:hypothetical protein
MLVEPIQYILINILKKKFRCKNSYKALVKINNHIYFICVENNNLIYSKTIEEKEKDEIKTNEENEKPLLSTSSESVSIFLGKKNREDEMP